MVKNPPHNEEDNGSIPGSERSPGEENGSPLQYSCLENPVDSTLVVMGLRRAGHELATEQLAHTSFVCLPITLFRENQ